MNPIIIIGTGLAGYQLAREFRKLDATSPLMLITADDGRFYSKPLLSTALTNKKNIDTLTTSTAETMAAQLNATIRTHSRVTAINPDEKTLTINNEIIPYSKLILATGAEVIRPALQGDAINSVKSVNDIHDYATFQQLLTDKKHISLLGAGLIGCEFANDLSNAGYEVHVIALSKAPLDLLIPEKIGRVLQNALEENGVHFHFESTLTHVNKNPSSQTLILTLSTGETIESELILSAIGLRPNTSLAKIAGIKINRGIAVNRFLETNYKDIYALGDCAEVEGYVLPYITPLLNAARALAKTINNDRTTVDYPAMPVAVKTPAHPIVVCAPPKEMHGNWEIEINNNNVRALFFNDEKALHGFVLTNEAVKERFTLTKQIPSLF